MKLKIELNGNESKEELIEMLNVIYKAFNEYEPEKCNNNICRKCKNYSICDSLWQVFMELNNKIDDIVDKEK